MVPLYFGDSDKQLFGIYMPPPLASRLVRNTGIVLCPPIAQEYVRTHLVIRQLSGILANAGFHTFKFEYFALGDSSGESHEGSIEQWKKDIRSACHELKAMSGVSSLSLIGLRLGASLAAEVFAEGFGLKNVLFWDPVFNGNEYLDEIRGMNAILNSSIETEMNNEFEEILGFPFSNQLISSIENIDLPALSIWEKNEVAIILSENKPMVINHLNKIKMDGFNGDIITTEEPSHWDRLIEYDQTLLANKTVNIICQFISKEW